MKTKLHDNACPKCGERFKRISGIWRCNECGINKSYRLDDGRPREGWIMNAVRVKPIFDPE